MLALDEKRIVPHSGKLVLELIGVLAGAHVFLGRNGKTHQQIVDWPHDWDTVRLFDGTQAE